MWMKRGINLSRCDKCDFYKKILNSPCHFFVIDILWLGLVARGFYKEQLGFIMAEKVNWAAAIIFYSFFIVGMVFFVINPALERQSLIYALLVGDIFNNCISWKWFFRNYKSSNYNLFITFHIRGAITGKKNIRIIQNGQNMRKIQVSSFLGFQKNKGF